MNKIPKISFNQKVWDYLVGEPSEFPLKDRIFNTVCIIAITAITFSIPFNCFIGLWVSVFISVFLLLIQGLLYYLSRFRNSSKLGYLISGLTVNIFLAINYYYNSGIDGPTLLLFGISYLLVIAISPRKQYLTWTIINLLLVGALVLLEYWYPAGIHNLYKDRSDRFSDIIFSYLIVIGLTYACISYIKRSYNIEKTSAENKARAMKQLNEEKNKLFSIISHDLRAPLANVQNYLELLTDIDLEPEEKQKFEADLLTITRNTQEMLTNLLSWSKGQMEGLQVNLTQTNIYRTLKPAIEILTNTANKKGIILEYHIDPGTDILANPDMLQLVVRNLVNNAIKFSQAGGTVTLRTLIQAHACLLTIQDRGTGIPANIQANLFSLNTKATYGTGNEKGVGLGLVLCKDFTEAQNGSIWFESTPGSGTCFYVQIPLFEGINSN